jgi:hypothetical protein
MTSSDDPIEVAEDADDEDDEELDEDQLEEYKDMIKQLGNFPVSKPEKLTMIAIVSAPHLTWLTQLKNM